MLHLPKSLLLAASVALSSLAHAAEPIVPDKDIPNADIKALIPHLTPLEGTTPAQWRVIWTGDASTEATISWTTAEKGSTHRVHFGTDPDKLDQIQEAQKNAQYRDRGWRKKDPRPHYHHASLQGLKPDTNYHFVLESDGERSRQFYFRTAPASGTDFSIIHGGDSPRMHLNRCRMNLLIAAQARDPKVLAFAHGGDFVYAGGNLEQWMLWLSQHELTTAPDGRVLPIIPTMGNHDTYGRHFKAFHFCDVFGFNKPEDSWYVTMLGEDVALMTLNTEMPASKQAPWIEEQLSDLRPRTKWLMAQYHRPMYAVAKTPAGAKPIFVPLFEKYNIDLGLESDGHCMKRTVPIRNDKKDPTGITYVGEGGLGVNQRGTKYKWKWYISEGGKAGTAHHIVRLDLSDDALRMRFIQMDGSIWDDHTLKPR